MKKSVVTGAAVLLLATGGVTSAADAKCDRQPRFRDFGTNSLRLVTTPAA